MASCLSGAPPGRPRSPSSPSLCFTTPPSMPFTLHPGNSLLFPVLSTLPQLWALVPVGCSFWKELFHSISIPLYSTHRNVSHHIPHSILFSSFQSLLQPGCLCVDHSPYGCLAMNTVPVQIMLLKPTRTHNAEFSMQDIQLIFTN